jgi:phosphoribosylamine--glycine ligase
MRILVVGSGGREHALAWKIARSPRVEAVLAAPGSDGISRDATCFPSVDVGDLRGIVALARREAVDLVVVGPEGPLAAGLADRLRSAGVAVFGPSQRAARLESSKTFAKRFMARHDVPTASFETFDALAPATEYVRGLGGPCVVKGEGFGDHGWPALRRCGCLGGRRRASGRRRGLLPRRHRR